METATDAHASSYNHEIERHAKEALFSAAPVSSSLRKAQVRAALFRKLEPVRIARFILLEPLGAGAMGEIYAAYDDQLDRKVALKLVRGGTGRAAKADERLRREAQTLARVSHPNVVQVYETGTYSGQLFIAMELIHGKTLSSWLEDAAHVPRAVRQREILRQFIAAGRGLEAAHAAGLAHRDFKPDNVLVGDDGRVRVVDFGLARALVDESDPGVSTWSGRELDADSAAADTLATDERERGDATVDPLEKTQRVSTSDPVPRTSTLKAAVRLTETGTTMGTPSYMAPETLRGAIADQRSDQFSFCVALYRALYDAFPFSGHSLRELRDSMERDKVAYAPSVAVPAFVRKVLDRGLSVEPSQRFANMGELLAALEPAARRHRGWIAATASVLAIALGGGMYLRSQAQVDPCAAAGAAIDASWPIDRQVVVHAAFGRSDLPFAEATWRGVKTRIDRYTSSWRDKATAACQATNIAHTQSEQQLDKRMLCLDRGKRQLVALVTELGAGAPDMVEHAIEATEALPDLDACSRAEDLLFGLAPAPAPVAAKVAKVRDQLARASTLELLGRYDEALAIARDATVLASGLGYPPVHAEALAHVARGVQVSGTADARAEAERLYLEALDIAEAERHDQLAAEIWNRLVMLAVSMDSSMAQAHAWWKRNAAAVHRIGDDAYEQAKLYHALNGIDFHESKYAQAADEERRAIKAIEHAPEHQLELSRCYSALAKSLDRLGDRDEALQLYERALAIAVPALGSGHLDIIRLQTIYGWALKERGQFDRARSMFESALESMPARYRDTHLAAAKIHSLLSDLECEQGHLDRAVEHGRASLAIYQHTQSPEHVRLAEAYTALANVEFRRRKFDNALVLYTNALALRHRYLDDDAFQIGTSEVNIAETLLELERHDDAMSHLREAERILMHGSSRVPEFQAWVLTVHGEIVAGQGKFSVAIPVLEQALERFGDGKADPSNHALAMFTLSRVLHGLGRDVNRVRSLAQRAHAIFTAQGAAAVYRRDAVARFLDQLLIQQP